jgi:hypothetical protein
LFKCLSLKNILALFQALLLERKVVLVANQTGLLTPVSEAILSLLFPFQWQYTCILLQHFWFKS